jgi:hypothetical protein
MQNWNTLIEYIKLHLGAPSTMLEMTDEDIQKYILDNCLPEISAFDSDYFYCKIGIEDKYTTKFPDNLINHDKILSKYKYILPIPENIIVLDIYDIYKTSSTTVLTGMLTQSTYMVSNPADVVMSNQLQTMVNSLKSVEIYEFIRPNVVILNYEISDYLIAQCHIVYNDLNRMPSDTYHEIFKKKCLGEIKLILSAKRSKFESLDTPYGNIKVNWNELKSDANQLLDEVTNKLDAMPPAHLITWMT